MLSRGLNMWCGAPLLALAYSGFPNTLWREFHEQMPTPARDITLDIRTLRPSSDIYCADGAACLKWFFGGSRFELS